MIPIYEERSITSVYGTLIGKVLNPFLVTLRYHICELPNECDVPIFTSFNETGSMLYRLPNSEYGIIYSSTENHGELDNIIDRTLGGIHKNKASSIYSYMSDGSLDIKDFEGITFLSDTLQKLIKTSVISFYKSATLKDVYFRIYSELFKTTPHYTDGYVIAEIPIGDDEYLWESLSKYFILSDKTNGIYTCECTSIIKVQVYKTFRAYEVKTVNTVLDYLTYSK